MAGDKPDPNASKPKPPPEHVEETLDDALDDSFPASDPPSTTQPGGKRSLHKVEPAEDKPKDGS